MAIITPMNCIDKNTHKTTSAQLCWRQAAF